MDACHLASTSWLILMTRLMISQKKKSGCVQPTAHFLLLGDTRGWSNLIS